MEALNLYSIENRYKKTKSHPTVKDIMSTHLLTLYEWNNLLQFKSFIEEKKINHVPILNAQHELVGLVTKKDFLKVAISKLSDMDKGLLDNMYKHIPLNCIMQKKVITTLPETSLEKAALTMARENIGCLPVVDGTNFIGIITRNDFLRVLYELTEVVK